MDLIVTHTSGDFDSLASLIAAKKLYPEAELILPRTPEKQVRKFLSLYQDIFKLKDERHFDFSKVSRLIIVDTSLKSRIGRAAEVLKNKKVIVHIFDHHPPTGDDIKADKEYKASVGATITTLLGLIIKKKIKINPLEATVFALGIYEDTGCLTFRTTVQEDIDMVSYLYRKGLNLNLLSHYLNRQLTEDELDLLIKLIAHTRTFDVSGVNIAIASIKHSDYIPDLAILTHRLIDIENFNVIFVLVKIGKKIQMLARSRIPYIDVHKIATYFGGGGHASASSGIIRGYSISKAEKKIIELIKSNLKPEPTAKDIMSYPVKTIEDEETVNEARDLMSKFNIGGLPILKNKKLSGIITRTDVDKAIYHGLGHSRVKGYMSKNIISLEESASLLEIQKTIFDNDIGRIPITKKGLLTGIVTRGDILRVLHKNLGHTVAKRLPETQRESNIRNLSKKIKKVLPREIYKLLISISKIADKEDYRIYVVGGFVRDLILGYKNFDIDLVIEEQAIEFAKILKKKLKCSLVTHARFGTAILIMKNGFKIDLATSRTEFYEYPAALPTVQFSNIKNDLSRRDFTINAMAMGLNKDNFAKLIDFYGGQKDIKDKKIRVLHNLSFVEDPTRIFRAVKFEQRYNFKIDSQTEHLVKTAVDMDMFLRVAGERIREELIPILSEKNPLKGIMRMQQLHEFRFIHPKLKLTINEKRTLRKVPGYIDWYQSVSNVPIKKWLVYFICLLDKLNRKEIKKVTSRLVLSNADKEIIKWYSLNSKKIPNNFAKIKKAVAPSKIYKVLRGSSSEALLVLMAKVGSQAAISHIKNFICDYRDVKLKINGNDIKKLGLDPSPDYGRIMDKLLYLKLDKGLTTRPQELNELTKLLNIRKGKI